MKNTYLIVLCGITIFSCIQPTNYEKNQKEFSISQASLKSHIETLASDDFQGRKPFTVGETKTVNYLVEQFKKFGLEPGNGGFLYSGSTIG